MRSLRHVRSEHYLAVLFSCGQIFYLLSEISYGGQKNGSTEVQVSCFLCRVIVTIAVAIASTTDSIATNILTTATTTTTTTTTNTTNTITSTATNTNTANGTQIRGT